jgi:hypothetical protein
VAFGEVRVMRLKIDNCRSQQWNSFWMGSARFKSIAWRARVAGSGPSFFSACGMGPLVTQG